MTLGDTSLTLITLNPSNNDTIFQAVLQFEGLLVEQSVIFDANGGTGTMADQLSTTASNLVANSFENSGYTFAGWNTQSDGLGTSYADGASYPFTSSQTLYAQWTLAPEAPAAPAAYSGPLLTNFSSRNLDPREPTEITITGSRLSDVVPTIQGWAVKALERTENTLVLEFLTGLSPANGPDLVLVSASGRLTVQDALDIRSGSCAQAVSKGRWTQLQPDGKTVKIYA